MTWHPIVTIPVLPDFRGVTNKGLKMELLQILPFKLGSLPMKYLGVPLIAKKLGVKDCKCLVDNVEKRINYWRNKLLSYAVVVKDLDKLFKRFLWNSGYFAKGKAMYFAKGKTKEGLVNTVKLKGKSFWELDPDTSDSWGWKSMLETKDKLKPFVIYKIGDGNETVKDGISNGRWEWPDEWNGKVKMFVSFIYASNSIPERRELWNKLHLMVKKMRYLIKALNDQNWKNGNLFDKVLVLKQQLKDVQSTLVADPFNQEIKRKAVEIHSKYIGAIEDELKLLRQTAKIKWLKEGDKNSAFFHSILKSRKSKNRVESICGEDGERFEGSIVADQFLNHFQNFLGKANPVKPLSDLGDTAIKKLSKEVADSMIREVTDEDNQKALFDIDSNKAASPNGFTSYFFKKSWSIIGKDICLAVKYFFKNGKILGELNATLIALVPKIETPGNVSDFRPIACCNVLYKCIRTHIQDNILIAQEFFKGYNRKQGAK
ncbi:hypothetical protein Tco_1121925, partial [Tanacetum coccineum]